MSEEAIVNPELDPVPTEAPAPTEGVAGPLNDIDPEKLRMLEERLKEFKENQDKTVSGSEAPESSFDLSQFEVEPGLEHLYHRSRVENTEEGPKWVVLEHQYMIQSGLWHVEGGGAPLGKDKKGRMQYRTKGLDQIITEIINGPDGLLSREKGWRLSALLPGSAGSGIAVFERQAKRALPDPKPIEKPEEQPLEETTDEELARMEAKSEAWTGEERSGDPDSPTVVETAVEVASDQPASDVDEVLRAEAREGGA